MPVRRIDLPDVPRRIAILKPSALGDIAHSLPVLTALRERFPRAHIAWIVNCAYAPILDGHPDLDDVIPFDRGAIGQGWLRGPLEFIRCLREIRSLQFDVVIDLQGLLRTGLMTGATGASVRIGLASGREGSTYFYTHCVDDQTGVTHAVDRYWRVIEALGDAPKVKTFRVPVLSTARAWVNEQLSRFARPWIVVGVGSRWLTKRWPPDRFAELVNSAQDRFGGTAILVGTPDEAKLARQAQGLLRGPAVQLTGTTTLPQLVAVLAEADVMIANDTGPLHLAVALGRPVVAPYTCTLIDRTGPYGQLQHAVATSVDCAGSYLKTCPHMKCMPELTPARLWPALEMILQRWQRQNAA
ncbi:MAG: glycosyltransferase family 9 protein [Planctomycetes bacterium]|nr:glycosyltransferase family 9 protein [Planctomycetota bacterium]